MTQEVTALRIQLHQYSAISQACAYQDHAIRPCAPQALCAHHLLKPLAPVLRGPTVLLDLPVTYHADQASIALHKACLLQFYARQGATVIKADRSSALNAVLALG